MASNIRDCKAASAPSAPPTHQPADPKQTASTTMPSPACSSAPSATSASTSLATWDACATTPRCASGGALTDRMQQSLVPGAKGSMAEPPSPAWWKPLEQVFHLP